MKNRSHRLPQSNSPDDWLDGSWTVDCSCGVTFDDGEEMVSCDECGVWVHTRCSRFVKGETSFACHNCKKKNNSNSNNLSKKPSPSVAAANTEETEVAQLLIELPTKTESCPPPNPLPGPVCRPPFRLWAEVPMEDRVHVQGVPGGDPSLFQGISSSIFSPELWRCTGYVPKKFNFQYREFPCRDEDGGENPASQGADVLFSLSKEIGPPRMPVRDFERKQEGGEKVLYGSRLQSWGKKERNKLRVLGSHPTKRRKEEDHSGKKKKRADADRVAAEFKRKGSFAVSNGKKAGLPEDLGIQILESNVAASKNEEAKEEPQLKRVDSVKKKKSRNDDNLITELKKRVSVPVADVKAAEASEDGAFQVVEQDAPCLKSEGRNNHGIPQKSDVPSVKNEKRKEEVPSQSNGVDQVERTDSDSKPKHVLVIRASKEGPTDEAEKSKNSLEVRVNFEMEDEATGISLKVDIPVTSQDKQYEAVKEEDLNKAVHGLKQPNNESHFQGDLDSSSMASCGSYQKNDKINLAAPQQLSEPQNPLTSMKASSSASAATATATADFTKKQHKVESHVPRDANSSARAKVASSGSSQKNEKMNQPVPQPVSKLLKHSISLHPPSAAIDTTLSDQEFALRLHQELNSSPRVPKVPRMRQTSLQTSQSAPSMLSKRSSGSGGRDQAFRRKTKEGSSRDGSHNFQESNDEMKTVRAISSPDRKHQEPSFKSDGSGKKDSRNRSSDTVGSTKKSGASVESENRCRSSFEASGQNTAIKSSLRDVSDGDATPRTLPGLIDEILSKYKCSTYEELCDAVQPYWHNVRKPNGELYAYSSHSHAVLDCLRNRSEWAHLIDRVPKTNSSKRRRKLDSDTPITEESESEDAKSKSVSREMEDKHGDSHREDFPKGKRKARKRRRLELRGRCIEQTRKRKPATSSGSAAISDGDDDDNDDGESGTAFSHTSNEGGDEVFSEDESQENLDHAVVVEASASTSPYTSR